MATTRKQKVSCENSLPAQVPDDPAVQAWIQLVHSYHRIVRRLEQALAEHDLTLAQFEILARLHFDGVISQNELARRLLVTKGNICGLLDRMAAANLVTRRTDPADRRANQLHMTTEGRRRFAAVFPSHIALIQELMGELPNAKLQQLAEQLAVVSHALPQDKCAPPDE